MSTPDDLRTADRQARIDALDLSRSFIVQAPAGSGKTELLIQRYLKLLSVVEHPEEVIAITFTRKAAAEMLLRVVNGLRRSRDGMTPIAEHEKLTAKLADAVLARSKAHGWDLISNPRRLRIMTLDSLNASIARSRPISHPGTGSRVVVGSEQVALYQAAAMATLDWLGENDGFADAAKKILRHLDNNTWLYTSYLSQMLGTRDQWLPFVGSGLLDDAEAEQLRTNLEENLHFAVTEHLTGLRAQLQAIEINELVGLLDKAASNLRDAGNASHPIARLNGATDLPDTTAESVPNWVGVADFLLTDKGEFRKRLDKRQGVLAGDKETKGRITAVQQALQETGDVATELHATRHLPPVRFTDEQWQVLLSLFRVLPLAATELKRLFAGQGIVDHIEVALTAAAALGTADEPGDIALLLDYQLKHLLVDEMQDTSAAQYRMLETLTAGWQPGDGRTLYCVGDPMQSIYRFRNAEVGHFLLARQQGLSQIALQPLLLRRNFRSGENLVHWFNTVFPEVLAAEDDVRRSAVAYEEAIPVPELKDQGNCSVHAIFDAAGGAEAAAGLTVIKDTLAANPDDTMAVLVRGRTQLPSLLAELRAAGITYNAVEIDRLTDLPEVIDILALTRASVHLGDRIAWLGVLRGPWIGLDWTDINTLVANDSRSTVWELLHDQERIKQLSADGRGAIDAAMPVLQSLTAPRRSRRLAELVESCWFALGGPGMLGQPHELENIFRYLAVLSSLEYAGTLRDVGELEAALDMQRISNNDSARLQIMTMHRSKGLQFDHVLLYGLGRQSGRSDRRVLTWFDHPNQHGLSRRVIGPVGGRTQVDHDPIHRYIELAEAEKDRFESARLLYVACTRARKSLHIMGHTNVAKDGKKFLAPRRDCLLNLLWPAIKSEFAHQFENYSMPNVDAESDPLVWPELRRFGTPWNPPLPTPVDGLETQTVEQLDDQPVEYAWVGDDARIAGTLVHRWLERLANDGNERFSRTVSLRWLRETGVEERAVNAVADRIEQAVRAVLDDEKGRWILEAKGFSELKLSGVVDGVVLSVVLDRVCIDAAGTHWIIDYKTSSHEGGNLEVFLSEEQRRYEPQLRRYAALYRNWSGENPQCALYFPLLKTFREVAV